MNIWQNVHDLFDNDDGLFPDIYVENLDSNQVADIYSWIRSIADIYDEPTLWDNENQKDVPIRSLEDPAGMVLSGQIDMFRHLLEEFEIDNVKIPQLSVEVSKGCIVFDYWPGDSWGQLEIMALFKFLARIKDIAPEAKIFQADEGCYKKPNDIFAESFESFYSSLSG